MATRAYPPVSMPTGYGYGETETRPRNEHGYTSSRRSSSSSSSGSQSGRVIARPQSHIPTSPYRDPQSSSHSSASDQTEVLASSQPDLQAVRPSNAHLSIPSTLEGKQRAVSDRPATMFSIGEQKKKEHRSGWMVDDVCAMDGADAWVLRDRVMLILGRPTLDSLSPLLYNPQYASTLLLIALSTPSSSFAQLAAQTRADRTTYPIIQLLDMKSIVTDNPSHPLPSLLEKAGKIATQWRASLSTNSTPRMSWMGAGSRTSSADSIRSSMMPGTPPLQGRSTMSPPSAWPRRSSDISTDSTSDINSRRMSAPVSRDRPVPSSRKSSFFGLGKGSESKTPPPASPFDAVLHFVPPASEFSANRALQEMLQRSILLTSTVIPILAKRNMSESKSFVADPIPVSLLHILPSESPAALPPVIENFVLSLLPSFQSKSERPLSGLVVNQAAWLHPAEREFMSGGDILLFGGAKVRPVEGLDGGLRVKARAYIPYWPHQGPPMAVAPNPDFTRPDYSTMVPVQPTPEKAQPPRRGAPRSPPSSRPATRHHRSGLSQSIIPSDLEDFSALNTPDLDHAPSSASSQSHEAMTPRASTYGSELGSLSSPIEPTASISTSTGKEHKKGGFGTFVKRFGKKKQV